MTSPSSVSGGRSLQPHSGAVPQVGLCVRKGACVAYVWSVFSGAFTKGCETVFWAYSETRVSSVLGAISQSNNHNNHNRPTLYIFIKHNEIKNNSNNKEHIRYVGRIRKVISINTTLLFECNIVEIVWTS